MSEQRLRARCGTQHSWGEWTYGTDLQRQLQVTPYGCPQIRECKHCGQWDQRARPFDYERLYPDDEP